MMRSDDVHPAVRWLLVALAGLVIVVVGGLIADSGTVGSVEESVFHAVNDLPGWLYQPLWIFQQFGNLVVAIVVGIVVALALRRWEVALAVLVAAFLKLRLEETVKDVVQRSRPGTSIGDVHLRGDVSVGGLSYVSGHAVITSAIAGLGRREPWLAILMTLFLLSLTGIPPTAGFFAKAYVILAAVQASEAGWTALGILAVIAVLNAAAAAFYYLRVVVYMFMREPRSEEASLSHGRLLWGGLVVASVLTVVLGVIPGPFLDIVGQAARAIGG